MGNQHTNSLIDETSPYLLQHAHNPVDWRAWNEESLAAARRLDKPILLSIGYSACHWCHVMEHESFEDEDTAAFMNKHFVCVKVDREERPDLDKIYQLAHQMLTQRPGGWPLNVVITPDTHAPFFAGTYFPKVPRHGMPSFKDVLARVNHYYRTHRDELAGHTDAVLEAFNRIEPNRQSEIYGDALDQALKELADHYDGECAGFGSAPKFPHPTNIELCLRSGAAPTGGNPDARSLHMARETLSAMGRGGIFDQLGGGFFRYSVDRAWSIPHFEKMLYDNAQLIPLYADAWLATDDALFRDVALAAARWVIREMQAPDGGYYSSLDADSEAEEGRFYTWSTEQIEQVVSREAYPAVIERFGLDGQPNFEGKWHFNVARPVESVAERLSMDVERCSTLLAEAANDLLQAREQRVRPDRDDKILGSWNALMVKGMAHAGRVLDRQELIESATQALDYIRGHLWRNGRLLATARGGRAHLNAYLDDYAFLIDAVIELSQSRWRSEEVEFAVSLSDVVLSRFQDDARGGFFFTSDDHEQLLHRTKASSDDAMPSGNGVAARVLTQLGHLLGDHRYIAAAERTLKLFSSAVSKYPSAHASLVVAMEEFLHPSEIFVIRGDVEAAADWIRPFAGRYLPRTLVFLVPDAPKLPGVLSAMRRQGAVTAYHCQGTACSAPINTLDEFITTAKERFVCLE